MAGLGIKTVEDAKAIINERGIDNVKVGFFDSDGIMRGKYMSKSKFFSSLDKGFAFCDVVLGWDSNDALYDNVKYTGWHTGYPDAPMRIIPDSCRELSFEENTLLFLAEFTDEAEKICPRGTLRRVLKRADDMGLAAFGSCEFEFFVFNEDSQSVREKGYRNLENITPGAYGYSMLRSSVYADYYEELLAMCVEMDFPIEGLHTETGPGVLEAALAFCDVLGAADKAALFKTYTKIMSMKRGWMATFMAKHSPDWPGQSGHIHLSLQNKDGSSAFYDDSKPDNMSDQMRWFIGGQQALMPEFLAMVACTVNSYTRLIPGFWAPTEASWGVENRTCALRAIMGSPNSQRVEYRISAADINPYIALSAALGSGLWGIENKIEPDKGVIGTTYHQKFPAKRQLPRTLMEAAERFKRSKPARDMFGDEFVDHYSATREWEEREFRKAITDWEMQRYFEII